MARARVVGCGDLVTWRVPLDGADALAGGFDRRLGLTPVGRAVGAGPTPRSGVDALAGVVSLLGMGADAGVHDLDALARAHVARHVDVLVGRDGGIRPETVLRPDGAPVSTADLSDGWARRQAWGVLRLAVAGQRWGGGFTDAGCPAARWWLARFGQEVPVAVLGRPGSPVETSAAVITAAGLLTCPR
ncbi:hypothetical protein O7631_18130 [Micromonospora sp. WMMD967]|uniref:hypothetical protein n=1 Tax=Micromonospora sp. WMMD967 TaxID=3016101 RepID=UPI002416192E|nr:hypothetical protein [Micromonospora sp. WMMD967]MDG4838439.1 hypothetical protein [Micromonospora sp. WMMD967]